MASEYCAPGVEPAPGAQLVRLLGQLEQTAPDGLGGLLLQQQSAPVLAELGLDSALGVPVLDPETKAQAGIMVAGYAAPHAWRPHEKYFLQAVGDQMLLGVSHTRLRTMARTLGAADEKTGLLTRSSYLDCLVQESAERQVARHVADARAAAGGSRARSCCGSTAKGRWSVTSSSWRGRCSR